MLGDPVELNIKNTFVPNCKNETFSVNNLVFMLRQGFVKFYMIPDDIKMRVEAELFVRHPELLEKHPELKTKIKTN